MQINRPISIIVIIFIVLLLAFFFVLPQYEAFVSLQKELGGKMADQKTESDYYNTITKAYNTLQIHKDDLQKIDDALPASPDVGGVIYFLQQTAASNSLSVKSLFLSKSSVVGTQIKSANTIKDIIFSISLSGDYPSLEKFIVSLERSARLFEVTSISFGSSTQASQSQLQTQQPLNFNLQINTHSY